MTPSAEFLITLAALAAFWLSLRHNIRELIVELRKLNGDPADKRDIEFDRAIDAVRQRMAEPVSPREILEAQHGRAS